MSAYLDLAYYNYIDIYYSSSSSTSSGTYTITFNVIKNNVTVSNNVSNSVAWNSGGTLRVDIRNTNGECNFNAIINAVYNGGATDGRNITVNINDIIIRK